MTLESHRREETATEDAGQHGPTHHQAKVRSCLCCSEEFESAWAGERVCKKCRSSTRWRQGYD